MSYIKINDCQVLCAGTASPTDLNFDIKEIAGKNIKWAFGNDDLPATLARAQPGDLIIEVANAGVADDWYFAIRAANGDPVPGDFVSWRPDPPDPEAVLLAALHAWVETCARACGRTEDFESTGFDASSLIFAACDHPHILEALAFLKPEMHRRYWGVCLNEASRKRIDNWLWKMDGRTVAGFQLWRDRYGWARIERVR
jgi:hypothetical protein